MGKHWMIGLAAAVLVGASAMPAAGQPCNDFNDCSTNDMCNENDFCEGTPQSGGSCDDFNECTTNDTCGPDGCLGTTPAAVGTECGGGCGTCQPLVPVPGSPLQCTGKEGTETGDACDVSEFGNCLEGTCQIISTVPGFPSIAFCVPGVKACPDTDGNPCTDSCNFETGQCQRNAPRCVPICETCNAGTGACEPANEGTGCDDANVCTPQSRCEAVEIGGGIVRGLCMGGESTGPTPTPTEPPIDGCPGDCNGDGEVTINELIIGVNIALGSASIDDCPAFDLNGNGTVEINELIAAVNIALNGCEAG